MPKLIPTVSDAKIKNSKKKDKDYRIACGGGLYLTVKKTGAKIWRFDYTRPSGKRNSLSFGAYPAVTLADATRERDAAKSQLANAVDPSVIRKTSQAETFEAIAMEWLAKKRPGWAESHHDKTLSRLKTNVFPWIGSRPINDITATELLSVLQRAESLGKAETAHRCRSICGQIFRFAIVTGGRADRDVAADLRGALETWTPKPYAAVTDPVELAKLLKAIDEYSGHFVTRCALKLAPLVFLRPGELRKARWSEIDFDSSTWIIPISRMKLKLNHKIRRAAENHIVPLSTQAVAILRELHPLTGKGDLLFPSMRTAPDATGASAKPISDNTLNAALRYMGFDQQTMTSHGWRAIARTLLDEVLGHQPAAIERQLAHAVAGPLGASYDRTQHTDERRVMMQIWASYLDGLKNDSAKVMPLAQHNVTAPAVHTRLD